MTRVLVTVSGTIPDDLVDQVAQGRRPRVDYLELQAFTDADLLDLRAALALTGRLGALVARLAGAGATVGLAAHRRRHDYDVVLTDGEQAGIPFALLGLLDRAPWRRRRRSDRPTPARHAMIVHVVSTWTKSTLIRVFRLRPDLAFVYCSAQADAAERLGWPRACVVQTPFAVDTVFFRPRGAVPTAARPTICSVGLERRDHATLVRAVVDLDADVVVAAASPWSRRRDRSGSIDLPDNVSIARFELFELRELYERSACVVVPLEENDFQAGITTILEAMAMQRPVVYSRTAGQRDTVIDGVTGHSVPPGDVDALRAAIVRVLDDPVDARRIGVAARTWAVEHADVTRYARRIGEHVLALVDAPETSCVR